LNQNTLTDRCFNSFAPRYCKEIIS